MELTIGFSPCPNDTFIFDALVNGKVDTGNIRFKPVLEDVETLNEWALQGKLDITKLSYRAWFDVQEEYDLLHSGSALGKGVGPLLISQSPIDNIGEKIADMKIAIPGLHTTANMLLQFAFPQAKQKEAIIFSGIEDAVLSGKYPLGVIIHENRFTYQERGLSLVMDLGNHWEEKTGAPIPLGGIVIRKSLGQEVYKAVNSMIRESLKRSWDNYPTLSEYVKEHAQEMEEKVMRQHIELYVNDFTDDLGEQGLKAIKTMGEVLKQNR